MSTVIPKVYSKKPIPNQRKTAAISKLVEAGHFYNKHIIRLFKTCKKTIQEKKTVHGCKVSGRKYEILLKYKFQSEYVTDMPDFLSKKDDLHIHPSRFRTFEREEPGVGEAARQGNHLGGRRGQDLRTKMETRRWRFSYRNSPEIKEDYASLELRTPD